ncbi:helix-turn-helix transcriptional regulator [Acutalibacter sp. JLR.KK004]|uniref:helix-turn-helix domain-containing protein n=1 Tax=Acutalibacter sp. JLR.KK004 TaxID=3112622 RepID=UPI002FF0313C
MTDKRFGNRFKECRERLGITQQELAEMAKLPTTYISLVERGERFPRFEKLVRLLNCLGASADEVFCDVVEGSMERYSGEIFIELNKLPIEARSNILEVVNVLMRQAQKSEREKQGWRD